MVIIQLDSEQLSSVIQTAVKKALSEQKMLAAQTNEEEEFFNVEEASNFLDLTPRTLRKKARNGDLPVSKRAGRLYFSKKQLIEWLKAGSRKTNAEISEAANKHIQSKRKGGKGARV